MAASTYTIGNTTIDNYYSYGEHPHEEKIRAFSLYLYLLSGLIVFLIMGASLIALAVLAAAVYLDTFQSNFIVACVFKWRGIFWRDQYQNRYLDRLGELSIEELETLAQMADKTSDSSTSVIVSLHLDERKFVTPTQATREGSHGS